MSPAPYPPLHAGDDVDADFFDQLGDELDSPAQESVPQKHQDAGLATLADSPEALVSSGAGAWSSPPKVHPEETGLPLPQEGNSQVRSELEDAFTNLNLETQDAQPVSDGADEAHLSSNGDDVGLNHSPGEAVDDSEDRVTGVESSGPDSITSTSTAEDDSAAQLGVPEDLATSTSVSPETAGVENVEPESNLPAVENVGPESKLRGVENNVEPESKLHGELSFSAGLVPESGSVAEEVERGPLPEDQEEVKPPEGSKAPPAQTTKVEEVQWSNFGAQGGFGSFSDLLSAYPADSSQPQAANAIALDSEPDFFLFGDLSTSDVATNAVGDVSFFDLPHPQEEGETLTAAQPLLPSTAAYETLAPLQVSSGEGLAHAHSQGLEQQMQGAQFDPYQWQNTQTQAQGQQVLQNDQADHSQWNNNLESEGQVQQAHYNSQAEWQELSEYPGWLYNTVTGEWVEKKSGVADVATAISWDYASGQDGSQRRGGENETSAWQGHEATANASDETAPTIEDPHLGQPTPSPSVFESLDQNYAAQNSASHSNALSTEAAAQQNDSVWQQSSGAGEGASGVLESGWEDQYPGWYWDYQAQEWKPSSQLPQVVEEESQSTPVPAVSYAETTTVASSFSQGYNAESTSGAAGTSYLQSSFSQGYNVEPTSDQGVVSSEQTSHANNFPQGYNEESASVPAVSYEQSSQSNSFSQAYNAEWSAGQDRQYKGPAGQYGEDGYVSQNVVSGSSQNDGQRSSQAEPSGQWTGVPAQQHIPSSYYQSGQPLSNGSSQQQPWSTGYNVQQVDPLKQMYMMPENQYNPYATAQMPHSYASQPQPWSSMNSYSAPNHPQYLHQTAPKSVEEALRTSVGRPPHVLAAFAFGGKLLVMKLKDPLSLQSSDGNQSFASGQAFVPGPIQVHSLSQLVAQTSDNGRGETGSSYMRALNRPSLNGPLVGGSVSSKEVMKWLDEQAVNCLSEEPNFRSSSSLPMLWGLLKLACKHYGKLRSQSGLTGIISQEENGAEAALANLLTSGGEQSSWTMGSFSSTVCLQPVPSEHQLQVTASETKKLLVAGKRKEALKVAQQGQLWGAALVLARQLGEKYYADTVAAMAQRQFLPGSPLRTLSLLLAGQQAEVFRESNNIVTSPRNQPMQVPSSSGDTTEGGIGSMLDEWQENLSIMAANRTNGDERVISHLGDCLWKVRGEVTAAHICYLVADANFDCFSSSARLCLVGADHWANPRTYVTPEAIQRTEVYEYSKVLGNPQFILVSFQPYKLIYASMLAEVGKTGEALKYCLAVLKTLKTASRSPEVETCRLAAASLEERLQFHVQGGNSANFAPGKLVRGIFSILDKRIHDMIGGPPQPTGPEQVQMAPAVEPATLQDHLGGSLFGASPSRPTAPFGPSASAEKLKETGPRSMPQRSVSEPDFSSSMKEKAEQGKPLARSGVLGRFGSVFSKAGGIVSMVSKSSKKEAKLGDTNKFYYDEKLKRWVEEGVEASEEEAALAPPPTAANFAKKGEDATSPDAQFGVGLAASPPVPAAKNAHLGTPPVPPSNQYSARTRQQGVRSRYVDTFNKGGNSTTPSKPAVSAFAPAGRFGGTTPLQPMSFFVPPASTDSVNGSENGTSLGNSEENHTDQHSEPGLNIQQEQQAASGMPLVPRSENASTFGPGMPLVPRSENASTFGPGTMHGVLSSENTGAYGASPSPQRSGSLIKSPSNGDIGLSNGYHSRANSWGGYPSNFQISQTETSSSAYDNPAANASMYNGLSSQSSMNTPPKVGSYFPSPSKGDIYTPNNSESFASPPPSSITPFMPGRMGVVESRPGAGAGEARGGSDLDASFGGDDLQEVEL